MTLFYVLCTWQSGLVVQKKQGELLQFEDITTIAWETKHFLHTQHTHQLYTGYFLPNKYVTAHIEFNGVTNATG